MRSAALRKMEARSFHGIASQPALAASAPSMARATVASSASWYTQICRAWSEGINCLASLPVLFYCKRFDVGMAVSRSEYAYTKSGTHRFPINDDRDLKGKLLLHLCDRGLQGCALR